MADFRTGEGKTGVPSSAFRANYDAIDWTNTAKPVEDRPDPLKEALGALKEMVEVFALFDSTIEVHSSAAARARKVLADHGITV